MTPWPTVVLSSGWLRAAIQTVEGIMFNRTGIAAVALALLMMSADAHAQSADPAKYPDLSGGWQRFVNRGLGGQPSFDQTKPWGRGQEAPLTPEYQKVLEDSLADQAQGGQGNFIDHALCHPAGMPFMMVATRPLDFVVTPHTTYILVGGSDHYRRIFTDGRSWPKEIEPSYSGYSIGRWIDTDGDGRFDLLEAETRGPFKGRRTYDATGLPLHHDNQSVFKERISLDKTDPNLMHNEITVIDNALTRPWTVNKRYIRKPAPHPEWPETYCHEGTALVGFGDQIYYLSADGMLMPSRKDQPAPDLRYFKQTRK
jgi:hypothetical protein